MAQPGWYNDPRDAALARWHDGTGWTEHTVVKADWAGRGRPPPPEATRPTRTHHATPPQPRTPGSGARGPHSARDGAWRRFRRLPVWAQVPLGAVAALVVLGIVSAPFADGDDVDEATTEVSTEQSIEQSPDEGGTADPWDIPDGEDATVVEIIDGDTLDVALGSQERIRLIGVDSPERGACYSTEAGAYLGRLVPPQSQVRLVYDVDRTDRFGRTLAYLYRLSDGMFVNLAMAREGYALQLTVPPNVAHAEAFGAAVEEARSSARGLWSGCSDQDQDPAPGPATTAATPPPATTAAPSAPPATAPADSTNCSPAYPGVCIPPPPPDLNCADVPHDNFQVIQPDPHRFDGNGDGVGCEG